MASLANPLFTRWLNRHQPPLDVTLAVFIGFGPLPLELSSPSHTQANIIAPASLFCRTTIVRRNSSTLVVAFRTTQHDPLVNDARAMQVAHNFPKKPTATARQHGLTCCRCRPERHLRLLPRRRAKLLRRLAAAYIELIQSSLGPFLFRVPSFSPLITHCSLSMYFFL